MAYALQQLLQTPVILKVISTLRPDVNLFQRFYRMRPGDPAVVSGRGNTIGWDIFDSTRQIASGSAPGQGPKRITPRPIKTLTAQVYRAWESLPLHYDQIYRTRPLGTPIGTVDRTGRAYLQRQMKYLGERFTNLREFMASRLFKGGFGLKYDGDMILPVEKTDGSATVTVDFGIPAAHFNQLALRSGGADVINTSWATVATADIMENLLTLRAISHRLSGWPIRHLWMNSTTLNYVLNNAGLQKAGGSAYRVFESLTELQVESREGRRNVGYDIELRALPQFRIHVYDGGLNLTGSNDETATANFTPYLADGEVLFTPDPDPSWIGWGEGSEMIRKTQVAPPTEAIGFDAWTTPMFEPAGEELKMIDKGLPLLFVPKAVFFADVVF